MAQTARIRGTAATLIVLRRCLELATVRTCQEHETIPGLVLTGSKLSDVREHRLQSGFGGNAQFNVEARLEFPLCYYCPRSQRILGYPSVAVCRGLDGRFNTQHFLCVGAHACRKRLLAGRRQGRRLILRH